MKQPISIPPGGFSSSTAATALALPQLARNDFYSYSGSVITCYVCSAASIEMGNG